MPHVGVVGVVKAGAYGHGSVHVSRHLKATGVERLAVATVDEAIHLRHHDISGPIHIFGKRINTFPHVHPHASCQTTGSNQLAHDDTVKSANMSTMFLHIPG